MFAKNNNMSSHGILSLIEWRFEMAALYQRVSSSESLKDIWPSFIAGRKRLYQTHKQSYLYLPLLKNYSYWPHEKN